MILNILLVGLGGALGAIARYSAGLAAAQQSQLAPYWATLFVNVLGSGLMGFLAAWLVSRGPLGDQALWLFFGVGLLGAFTTFSAFSKDAVELLMTGEALQALAYIALNLTLSIAAFAAALLSLKAFLS